MNADHERGACDSEAGRLLPWFVTGRLDPVERVRVETHAASCPTCRAELDEQRALHGRLLEDEHRQVQYAPQASLQKLMTRIDELDRETPAARALPATRRTRPHLQRWLVAALVGQAIGLALLGSAIWRDARRFGGPAEFRTLASSTTGAPGRAHLRIVFAPTTTSAEIAALLGQFDARIVDGPSEAGAYALQLGGDDATPAAVDAALPRLRADARIVFAEPILATPAASR